MAALRRNRRAGVLPSIEDVDAIWAGQRCFKSDGRWFVWTTDAHDPTIPNSYEPFRWTRPIHWVRRWQQWRWQRKAW